MDVYFNIESCDTTFLIIHLKILGISFIKNYTYHVIIFVKYTIHSMLPVYIYIYILCIFTNRIEISVFGSSTAIDLSKRKKHAGAYTRVYITF